MFKYKVGDEVVANGYPGTVEAVYPGGRIDVRFPRGGVSLDGNDELAVEPIEVWQARLKFAKSDLRRARKEGSILIAQTRRGLVELKYDQESKTFSADAQGLNGRPVFGYASMKNAVEMLAALYSGEVR